MTVYFSIILIEYIITKTYTAYSLNVLIEISGTFIENFQNICILLTFKIYLKVINELQ